MGKQIYLTDKQLEIIKRYLQPEHTGEIDEEEEETVQQILAKVSK